ncbi:molybdopterin-dependent oxidoreductase [Cereibacter sphaeroides]|uniref:molybdopterin-dependent oxidoreductase n=1 Tax=Cereibacter sphaeroides TaxID=1063 RepID=UPI0005C16DFB|nr:molybdopterin-dependent oxidoreductase [Cereibacter sphaeroides]RHZ94338.1 oxidoreductase [Cereibacter sphaeroides]
MTLALGRFLALVLAVSAAGAPALATQTDVLPAPVEAPLLTVRGAIGVTNAEGKAEFDLPMLQSLPTRSYQTSTVWTEGVHEFEGVPLRALLERLGVAEDASVSAVAINDYAVEIPASAIEADAPIIAYHIDGATFSRREKGPLWVIFPYDADARYRSEVTYGQSIWQLDRLTVHP